MTDAGAAAVERFPVFPLQLVLFPGGLLPLRIFEPRYQRMVSECLRHEQPFVVVAIVDGPEAGGVATPAGSGTLARIIDWEPLADGLLGLLCEGEQIVAIDAVEAESDGLLRAGVQRLPPSRPQSIPADLEWMVNLLGELLKRVGPPFDRLSGAVPNAEHVAARLIELLPLPVAEKQRLFELDDSVERLHQLSRLIDPRGGRADTDG